MASAVAARGQRWVASLAALAGLLCFGAVMAGLRVADSDESPRFGNVSALAMIDEGALAVLADETSAAPVLLEDLADGAADALGGYALVAGSVADDRWVIDLSGHPRAADRAAFGLLELGVEFSRDGDDHGVLSGWGSLPALPQTSSALRPEAAERRLAAIVELGGSAAGRLYAPTSDGQRRAIRALASAAGLEVSDDGGQLWLRSGESLRRVSGWAYTCATNVPVVGGGPCNGQREAAVDAFVDLDAWLPATTGSLIPGSQQLPDVGDGGVSWTNREAQQYDPTRVAVTDDGLVLTAALHPDPDVDRLPYDSGLVVSRESHGFGRFEFDVTVPVGEGLWPAIWMLDVEACDAPGRCPRYATEDYHEIDLLETAGDEVGYFSVHWFDERIRSASIDRPVASIAAGEQITLALDRRPGLLEWKIDGEVVASIGGPARGDRGIHRSADMMIIMNLAVGGSFSGERVLGPSAAWWGDAMVPARFPQPGWTEASLVVHEARIRPL